MRSGEITPCCANSQDHCGKAGYGILSHKSPYKHEYKKHTCCMNTSVWVSSSSISLYSYSALIALIATCWVPSPSISLCVTNNTDEHFHNLVSCHTSLQKTTMSVFCIVLYPACASSSKKFSCLITCFPKI